MQTLTIEWLALNPRPAVSFLIATAVEVERDAVLELMQPLDGYDRILKVPSQESTYFIGRIGKYRCSLVLGEAGSDTRKGSALEIQAGISRWNPVAILAPGIAFGRRGDPARNAFQIPGDVLVSTQIYPYHHAKLTPDGEEDRGPHPEASIVLLDRIKNLFWTWTPPGGEPRKPILGPLLSGPYVLNDASARDNLFKRFPHAIGGEMEATGVYSASSRLGKDWLVLKAVCDWGAGKGDNDQVLAARNSASLLAALLSESGLEASGFARNAAGPGLSDSGWQYVGFSEQSDLRPAILGDSLGPAHVVACPPLPEVDDIVRALEEAGAVAVIGPSGSGKSMAAWHAAYRFHQADWSVYTRGLGLGGPPDPDRRALLVVDDVQAFPMPPGGAALATGRRRVLFVSTERVPGVRRTISILPERAVASLADALSSRVAQLLPVLHSLDSRVGDGAFEYSVEEKIAAARRVSKLPWQFMFNLGSGHLRLDAAMKALREAPPRDVILFAVAVRQLATMDAGADMGWLQGTLSDYALPPETLAEMLDQISDRIALVRVGGRVSTPHPEVADRILKDLWFGLGAESRRPIYWRTLEDRTVPLGGVAWLAAQDPTDGRDAPSGVVDRLLQRCREAGHPGHAGFVLATLLWNWRIGSARLRGDGQTIRTWLSAGRSEHAPGLARLVNELINADHSRAATPQAGSADDGPPNVAMEIVSGTPVSDVAKWANALTLDDDGAARADLLEHMANAASPEWRTKLGASLDHSRLMATVRSARTEQLRPACSIILAVLLLDQEIARTMCRELSPTIIEGMQASLPEAYAVVSDVFLRVLSFAPAFFGRTPDDEQRGIVRAILEGVGAASLATQLSGSRRREWNPWRNFSESLRAAAPELASGVGQAVDVDRLLETAEAAFQHSTYEVDELLVALALTEQLEPAATLVRRLYVPRRQMTWLAACIAPEAALAVIKAGATFDLQLAGGLPRWDAATRTLTEIASLSPEDARQLLRANIDGLADGLLYRQADGGGGAVEFLRAAEQLDRGAVRDAFRRLDPATARTTWRARIAGREEERSTIAHILALARSADGEIASLAAELVATILA